MFTFLNVMLVLKFVLPLLQATANALGKAGLANEAGAVNDALSKLVAIHDSDVTRVQLEGLRLDPDHWAPPAPDTSASPPSQS